MKYAVIFVLSASISLLYGGDVIKYQIPPAKLEFEPNPYEQEDRKDFSFKVNSKHEEIAENPTTNIDIEENLE